MNDNLLLGAKYYRYKDNDKLEVIRVTKLLNDTDIKVTNDDSKDSWKMTKKELYENYVKLNPHAVINFCIVKLKDGLLNDVVVTMHKMSDLTSNEPTPYCVCRQNITDIFANQIKISDKLFVGCCMSIDTCPPDIDYRIMIACDGMEKCINVCAYMDDTLDDILNMVNTKDFDRTLESLYIDHVNSIVKKNPTLKMMKERIMNLEYDDGYCKSLRLLLEQNNFMYDFYQAFRIIPIDKEVVYNEENVLSQEIVDIISDLYEINIISTMCTKYWYDINLDNIQNDYSMIMDKNNNLYVVAYISDGPKHINIENIESAENIERLANSTLSDNRSIREAADHIRLNKSKYN